MVDKSAKFRKLFNLSQRVGGDVEYEYRYNYIVSNIGYTKEVEQFNTGMAGFSRKTTRADRGRGLHANITIYVNHPEFKILPARLKKQFLMDLIIHETIHAYLYYNKPRFVDDDPDPTGKAGAPNSATLRDWMNDRYPLNEISDSEKRDELRIFRLRYGDLDIGKMSQKFIRDVIAEVEAANKEP